MRKCWRLGVAFLRRDFATDMSYKVTLAIEAADIVIAVAAFYYLSKVIGAHGADGFDAAGFLLIGLAANSAMTTAMTCFAQNVKTDVQQGALKPIMMAPVGSTLLIPLGSAYPLLRSLVGAAAYLAVSVLFGVSYRQTRLTPILAVSVASIGAFAALGLLSAAAVFLLKRGDPFVWMFSALSWFLGGVFVPVALLPAPLQRVAGWLPITHALNALRAVLLRGATLGDVEPDLLILVAIAAIGIPAGAWLVRVGIARAKNEGSLAHV